MEKRPIQEALREGPGGGGGGEVVVSSNLSNKAGTEEGTPVSI